MQAGIHRLFTDQRVLGNAVQRKFHHKEPLLLAQSWMKLINQIVEAINGTQAAFIIPVRQIIE